MGPPPTTIGILSIGDMGLSIANLLGLHDSEATHARARTASLELLSSDQELAHQSDFLLSIVPPRDAWSTAQRVVSGAITRNPRKPLYYLDLNAISPRSAVAVGDILQSAPSIHFIDGGIIGHPPKPKLKAEDGWNKPSIVVSGPHRLSDAGSSGSHLAEVLNVKHIAPTIGPGSGLKMCFASMNKGLTAIAIQAYTSAYQMGISDELRQHLAEYTPELYKVAEKSLVAMPPKAYRWVREMEEIADTLHDEGGFERDMFQAVSEVYRLIADDTELGNEKTDSRVKGKTVEDVARLIGSGLEKRKRKTD
ncbi:MAG: hypothetical protein M1812_000052 [Candelaria pacifica]|nr:MAG: hypothetical protein M1812_000052 [Candelaria pacifica]